MPEYIEREKLLQDISETVVFTVIKGTPLPNAEMRGANKVIDRVKSAPTEDVVRVVRCKDCKYCRGIKDLILPITHRFCCYRPNNFAVEETDFCSYGELKELGK